MGKMNGENGAEKVDRDICTLFMQYAYYTDKFLDILAQNEIKMAK